MRIQEITETSSKINKQKLVSYRVTEEVALGKYIYHVTNEDGIMGILQSGSVGEGDYVSMTADPNYAVQYPEVQIIMDANKVSQLETFEKHVQDWQWNDGTWAKADGDWESEYRVEELIPLSYVYKIKIRKDLVNKKIINLAKKRGVKLTSLDNTIDNPTDASVSYRTVDDELRAKNIQQPTSSDELRKK
jgi:hypothetical protein